MKKKKNHGRTEKFNNKHGVIDLKQEKENREKIENTSGDYEENTQVYMVDSIKKDGKKKLSPRKTRKRTRRKLIYFIVALVLFVLIGTSVYQVVNVKMEEKALKEENAQLLETKEELTEELTLINEPDYIEQQARTQLHLVKPGETLYVLPDSQEKKEEDK